MAGAEYKPLGLYRYRLTTVDALACERLRREWTGWQKVAFLSPLVAIGVIAGLLNDWPRWWWSAVFVLVLAWVIGGLAFSNWRLHRRAKLQAAREDQVEIEEWSDRIAIRLAAGPSQLRYEEIGNVLVTDGHVFILHPGGAIIVPLRAFGSLREMQAFGEAVDRRSRNAAP